MEQLRVTHFSTNTGMAILQWPSRLEAADRDDVLRWLEICTRLIGRTREPDEATAGASPPKDPAEKGECT